MPRLPAITSIEQIPETDRHFAEPIVASRGAISGPFTAFLHSPEVAARVADLGANILQISHSRGFGAMAIGETEVELILETGGADHIERIHAALSADKFKIKNEH